MARHSIRDERGGFFFTLRTVCCFSVSTTGRRVVLRVENGVKKKAGNENALDFGSVAWG